MGRGRKKTSTETGDVGHGLSILTNVPLIQDVSTRGSGQAWEWVEEFTLNQRRR